MIEEVRTPIKRHLLIKNEALELFKKYPRHDVPKKERVALFIKIMKTLPPAKDMNEIHHMSKKTFSCIENSLRSDSKMLFPPLDGFIRLTQNPAVSLCFIREGVLLISEGGGFEIHGAIRSSVEIVVFQEDRSYLLLEKRGLNGKSIWEEEFKY